VETGETVRRSCSTRDRDEAEARLSGIVAKAMNPAPTASYTIADLIKAYVRDRKHEDHSPTFEKTVYPALDYFGPMTPVNAGLIFHRKAGAIFRRFSP
jgi:hypothetical protein